jgi:hypothetical protein
MCKRVVFLISLILVLFLAGNTPAATFNWDNGGQSNLWNVLENWDPDGLPTSADEARIEDPNASCLIDSSVNDGWFSFDGWFSDYLRCN